MYDYDDLEFETLQCSVTGTLLSPQVVMIAHIPPGDPGNTLREYDEFYLNLTKRFRDTIVGHLFGHTHHDEFKLVSLYKSPLNINIFGHFSRRVDLRTVHGADVLVN